MMLDFVYENQTKIIFGKNALQQVGIEMKRFGSRVLVVSYANSPFQKNGLQEKIYTYLKEQGITIFQLDGVQPNPRMGLAYQGIQLCKENQIEAILAIGGGSVIDTCKTIGMGACYEGDAWDFFTGTQAHPNDSCRRQRIQHGCSHDAGKGWLEACLLCCFIYSPGIFSFGSAGHLYSSRLPDSLWSLRYYSPCA